MCLARPSRLPLILCSVSLPRTHYPSLSPPRYVLSLIMTLRLTLSFRTLFVYFVVAESRDTFFYKYVCMKHFSLSLSVLV